MKTKKKKTILAAILVILILGGAGAYVGGKLLLRHRVARWREEGIAASIAGDHETAASLLSRYLQRGPAGTEKYIEALRYYVASREQAELPNGQHFAETIGALRMLVSQEPDSLEDRRHLLRLYAKLERRPEALDVANAILVNRSHPEWANDVPTLQLKCDVLRKLLQDREALQVAEKWAEVAPFDVSAHMARLSLRSVVGQSSQVIIADAQKLHDKHPNDPRFELLLGYAYSLTSADPDSKSQAEAWLKLAAGHAGLSDDLTHLIIEQFEAIGMPDEALDLLQSLVSHGAGKDIRYTLARRFWEMGRWGPAADLLGDLNLADTGSDPTLVAMRAIALATLGKANEAAACRSALSARKQASSRAWALLLKRIIDGSSLDDKEVVTSCRSALSVEPHNPYLAYYLGDAEFRLLEFDMAGEAWKIATADAPTWGIPATRLVEVLLRQGHPEQAQWIAYDAFRRSHTAGPAIAMARAYASSLEAGGAGQADELFKLTNEIQEKIPGDEGTLLVRIQVLGQMKKNTEAVNSAREALGRTPAHSEQFILTLAAISKKFGLGLEDECFSRSEQAHGLTAAMAYARAIDRLFSASPDAAAGLRLFDDVQQRAGKSQDVEWRVARARYLDLSGNPEAKAAWIVLGDAFPDTLSVQSAVSSARAVQGDWDVMDRTIARLHSLTGDKGLEWRKAQARLMVGSARNDGDYEKGAVLLKDVIKEYPFQPDLRVLLARALEKLKLVDGAIEQLSVAAKLDPYSVPIALQLASLLQSRGDFERVQQELDRVTPQIRSSAERHQAAILLAQQGNSERATQLLEHAQTQPSGSNEGSEDLLLAVLYRRRREFDKCDAVVKKLLEQPNLAVIQFAASLYASQGRHAEAEAALARLEGLKLDPGIKEMVWGSYRGESGDLSGAVDHFQAATDQAPTNAAAWRLLATSQAAAGRTDASMATVDRALHVLPADAALKAIHSYSDRLKEAGGMDDLRPIVLFILRDPVNSDTAYKLLIYLLDARKSNDMELLASQLRQMVEHNSDFLPGHLQLAQALASMGRRDEALAVAQHALILFPSSPEPARMVVRLCAAGGHWTEMETAANTWRTRSPEESAAADVALAQAHLGLHRYESAMGDLRPYLPAASGDPERYADLLTVYSISAIKSGQSQIAESLLWPLAQKSSAWRIRWVIVAMAISDARESIRWLDQVYAIVPAEELEGRVAVAEAFDLLGERSKDAALTHRSAELFGQICNEPKVTASALVAAGAAAERRGDVNSAASIYRHALNMDANLWVAQNNLAVLIARGGGDMKEAAVHAAAAAALEPRQATIRDTLAEVQAKAGDVKAAAETEQMAIKLEPLNAKWRLRLARYLLDSGNIVDSEKAIQNLDDRRLDFREFPPAEQRTLNDQLDDIRKRVSGGRKSL